MGVLGSFLYQVMHQFPYVPGFTSFFAPSYIYGGFRISYCCDRCYCSVFNVIKLSIVAPPSQDDLFRLHQAVTLHDRAMCDFFVSTLSATPVFYSH